MQTFIVELFVCSVIMSAIAIIFIVLSNILLKYFNVSWLYYTWFIIVIGFIIPYRPDFKVNIINKTSNIINAQPIINSIYYGNVPIEVTNNSVTLPQIFFFIWLIGFLICIFYHLFKHYKFIKITRRWSDCSNNKQTLDLLENIKSEMKITKNIGLKLSYCIGSPMLVGFLKPTILIPTKELSKDELSFIFKHELINFKRK